MVTQTMCRIRSGFLFGPNTVEDQVTGNTFSHFKSSYLLIPEGVKAEQYLTKAIG